MSTEQPEKENGKEMIPTDPGLKNMSRRTFTKAGLTASGVMMTLTSRSVLACEQISPSGFCSANQSRHGKIPPSNCRRPPYWNNDGCGWPVSKNVYFRDVFHSCPVGSPYYKYTCAQILAGECSVDTHSNQCVGQYFVAAYLNACSGWSNDFLPLDKCVPMCNEWLQTGVYRPTATVTWNCGQIVTYFQNTQS